jgi:hypothetical protein
MIKLLSNEVKSPKGLAGFTLYKEYEDENYYIFRKYNHTENYLAGYELFERKINTMFKCETVPGGEAFGVWAWQLPTLQKAYDKLKQIKDEKRESD